MSEMIPLAVPNLCGNERKYLNQCVDENFVSSVGPFVDRFEKMVAQSMGTQFGVSTASGTSALHLALKVLGVGPGDHVITPSYTFVATVNSIIHAGAEPWLFDVEADSWSLNAEMVERELRANKKNRVKAILPVYLNGAPADMDHFKKISQEFNIPILADGAAAIGAHYKGRNVSEWAELTTISFNGNKIVTCGGGGAIVTNNSELAKKAKHLCTTARVGTDYNHDEVGFNYRMTNIEAAVGCAQLENLQLFLDKKKKIFDYYNEKLMAADVGLSPFPSLSDRQGTCWLSGVVLNERQHPSTHSLIAQMAERGVTVRPFWQPAHLQKPYKNFVRTSMNVCESFWSRVINLPCSTQLTQEQQDYVIKNLLDVLRVG